MVAITWLVDVLRAAGVPVVEEGDWQSRSTGSSFDPIGVLWHHTAGVNSSASRPAPSLGVCINGRPDLDGPLCHAMVDFNGVFHVIAAGRANHAGAARASGPIPAGDGNTMLVGWEIDYSGDQDTAMSGIPDQAMSAAQYTNSVIATAAVLKRLGRDASFARGHRETSTTGKIDPSFVNLDTMRADVARQIAGAADVVGSSVVLLGGRVWVFGRSGVTGDVYESHWDGQAFTGWDSLAAGDLVGRPSAVVFEGQLNVFARGKDRRLYQTVLRAEGWDAWHGFPDGQLSGDPQAVVYRDSLQVYAAGLTAQGDPGAVFGKSFDSRARQWSDWVALPGGGQFVGRPSVVSFEGNLHVFARGLNQKVYQQVFTPGQSWRQEGWVGHDGLLSGNPRAVVYGDSLQVYGAGLTPEGGPGAVFQRAFDPSSRQWVGWVAVPGGGEFVGQPSPIVFGQDLHVFARGANNSMYEQVWTAGVGWRRPDQPGGAWFGHEGTLSSDPSTVVVGTSLQAYAIGVDTDEVPGATFYQRAWNGTQWLAWKPLPPGNLTD